MRALLLVFIAVLLTGCPRGEAPLIVDYRTLGELRVATRIDAVTYRKEPEGGASGFEHDLLEELASELGVPVKFIVYPTAARALEAVQRGDAHLAAASLGRNDKARHVRWSPIVRELKLLIAGTGEAASAIQSVQDLAGKTVTARKGTLAARRLRELQHEVPAMRINTVAGQPDQVLLTAVADGRIALLATDEAHLALAAELRPELQQVSALPGTAAMAWAMPDTAASAELFDTVGRFLIRSHEDNTITRLEDRYFGHIQRLSSIDIAAFVDRIQTRLPRYRAMFEEAGEKTGLDWRLLAAIGYQESQWDPFAISPTGVRGLMMLTDETATRMRVRDRLDPAQSIMGGAKNFKLMLDSIDPDVQAPDRTWMAVAAYNLGLGHLRGARQIANTMGRDNLTWVSLRTLLPLMSRPSFARRLKAGPARGGEAVHMTENVRAYFDILRRLNAAEAGAGALLPLTPPMPKLGAQGAGVNTSSPPM
ncbi:MAG: membrane-bound lytic murein transglycosylase MltF [Zoogloeaceae bacterium]|uniref:membrane-bound lytic murein transglycosylase MltF n=1 Tax=Denitromonas sp. TaxID=2734609 RepID=UPI001E0D47EA|nr:membrane-bound lytic murein transglycosylase MltF [Rhodocyclaceae bacterium]MCP5221475.1 membrane-bound lytic murein transglycosylase MltF [Zoogloeaceae bacterium]HQU88866.1 membrane-bound lytic murein transglycosylase MltF [Denitromonas sp.]